MTATCWPCGRHLELDPLGHVPEHATREGGPRCPWSGLAHPDPTGDVEAAPTREREPGDDDAPIDLAPPVQAGAAVGRVVEQARAADRPRSLARPTPARERDAQSKPAPDWKRRAANDDHDPEWDSLVRSLQHERGG